MSGDVFLSNKRFLSLAAHQNKYYNTTFSMKIQVFTSEDFKTANWSGGTTTELFIYPLDSAFGNRNFKFRLSTAKVDIENSKFTPLQGISRKLMVLDGQIQLTHENHHTSRLNKFDLDEFEGAWNTLCKGTCVDFNLMTQGHTKGNINALCLESGQVSHHSINDNIDWFFIYTYRGKINCAIKDTTYDLNKGDLLMVNSVSISNLILNSLTNSELILIEITL